MEQMDVPMAPMAMADEVSGANSGPHRQWMCFIGDYGYRHWRPLDYL